MMLTFYSLLFWLISFCLVSSFRLLVLLFLKEPTLFTDIYVLLST